MDHDRRWLIKPLAKLLDLPGSSGDVGDCWLIRPVSPLVMLVAHSCRR